MATIQYTIRGVPSKVDARLRRLARLRGKSLNQVVLEQLSAQLASDGKQSLPGSKPTINTDFDDLFGTLTPLEPEVEAVLRAARGQSQRLALIYEVWSARAGHESFSAFAKNDPRVKPLIRAATEIALPHTVIGELLGGFRNGNRFEQNYRDLQRVLAKPSSRVLMPTFETAEIYGRLYADLKKRGAIIPTNDIWIAALSLEYEGTLATFDADFAAIPDLRLVF
jgi:tRNA(fMet)-specific endonuclease VapC